MTAKKRKLMAAFTLVEVMTAILIVMIVVTGSSFLFIAGRSQVSLQKHYRAAAQLATQKLETLKAGDYVGIAAGTTTDSPIVLDNVSYTRSVTTVNAGSYKEVTVTVSWQQGVQGQQGNNPHNVSIVTCIAP
ncbi:MAG: prepilin-type N-terminal cleavage/methylation domain-containing protein [Phycisphaerae bacterium]